MTIRHHLVHIVLYHDMFMFYSLLHWRSGSTISVSHKTLHQSIRRGQLLTYQNIVKRWAGYPATWRSHHNVDFACRIVICSMHTKSSLEIICSETYYSALDRSWVSINAAPSMVTWPFWPYRGISNSCTAVISSLSAVKVWWPSWVTSQ